MTPLYLDSANYTPLIRFGVFQSEGGPVPNGATIQSATLQLYKQYYDDTIRLNALLKPWVENQATWQLSQTGVPWSAPAQRRRHRLREQRRRGHLGAVQSGLGQFRCHRPGAAVGHQRHQQFRLATGVTASTVNAKTFNSSEYTTDPTLRPN